MCGDICATVEGQYLNRLHYESWSRVCRDAWNWDDHWSRFPLLIELVYRGNKLFSRDPRSVPIIGRNTKEYLLQLQRVLWSDQFEESVEIGCTIYVLLSLLWYSSESELYAIFAALLTSGFRLRFQFALSQRNLTSFSLLRWRIGIDQILRSDWNWSNTKMIRQQASSLLRWTWFHLQ